MALGLAVALASNVRPAITHLAMPRRPMLRLAVVRLAVVRLMRDVAAGALLQLVQLRALMGRHHAIGPGLALRAVDGTLLVLEPPGFVAGERAAGHAVLDTALLMRLLSVDARRAVMCQRRSAKCGKQRRGDEGTQVHGDVFLKWAGGDAAGLGPPPRNGAARG